jgi:nucleotide-binding universal stress UspA family protein
MIQFQRILCPTDFSKFSFRAADYAVSLARKYEGEVHFLHVMPEALMHPDQYPYLAQPVRPDPEIRQRALDRLDAFVALSRAENIATRFSVELGSPVSKILDVAEADQTDLVCMGTHGREGFERVVLGSVAERVLRKSKCPVLTVSEPGEEHSISPVVFGNILCAVDFATLSLKAVEYSLSLAQEAGGRITLVNVLEWFSEEPGWESSMSVPEYRKQMEEEVQKKLDDIVPSDVRNWCQVDAVVRSGKPYRELLELAKEKGIELIVMGVRGRNPLDIMLFGSTTQQVIRHAECPVLTIPGAG